MLILCLDGHQQLAKAMSKALQADVLPLESRHFPDGEHYFNLPADVRGEDVVVLCHLHQPNDKAMGLLFMARHLKDMGARRVGLVAPYLAYMRQDIRFQPGECLTSKYFAELISDAFDYLVTIDPHLHRYHHLNEIYSIPTRTLHATRIIGEYLKKLAEKNPQQKLLVVGPDEESEQWAETVARAAGCEHLVLTKTRSGDRDVAIHIPDVEKYQHHLPVMVDDIISTGRTMLRTAEELKKQGLNQPLCIGVHAVFAEGALSEMQQGPIADIQTCNCIPHQTNQIDISYLLTPAILELVLECESQPVEPAL
ncbi:ribose-phosphate diphosphokinase [Bacterioplanoides sp.]|uniref:ribose-phosphate diphosphokinase n=1 Tax=Bacterioplanoides sp. TaxID=2066072 RepID=UPI003B5A374B